MDKISEKTLTLISEDCKLNMYGSTFIGTREYQQDRMLVYEQNELAAAVVCDGMGGMESGEKASQLAVDILHEGLKMLDGRGNIKDFLCQKAYNVNYKISEMKDEYGRYLKSGTTVVMAVVVNGAMYTMSAGDSRIYIIHNGKIKQLTQDHNYMLRLDEQLKLGIIDEQKYVEERPRAEALISFLGIGEPIIVDVNGPYNLFPDDIIILCSDGLTKGLSNTEIEQIVLENTDRIARVPDILIEATRAKMIRGMDNTTVVVMKYEIV